MIIGRKLHLRKQRMTMSKRKKYIIAYKIKPSKAGVEEVIDDIEKDESEITA